MAFEKVSMSPAFVGARGPDGRNPALSVPEVRLAITNLGTWLAPRGSVELGVRTVGGHAGRIGCLGRAASPAAVWRVWPWASARPLRAPWRRGRRRRRRERSGGLAKRRRSTRGCLRVPRVSRFRGLPLHPVRMRWWLCQVRTTQPPFEELALHPPQRKRPARHQRS